MTPRCSWPHFAMVVKFDGSVIPCCVYRIGAQYAAHGDARVVGNAFADGIWKVWNSPEYQGMRRLVSNPATSTADSATAGSFCEGCSKLFTSDHPRPYVTGKANSWDDFYVFDERGRVAKRSQSTSTALELGQTRNSLGVRR